MLNIWVQQLLTAESSLLFKLTLVNKKIVIQSSNQDDCRTEILSTRLSSCTCFKLASIIKEICNTWAWTLDIDNWDLKQNALACCK